MFEESVIERFTKASGRAPDCGDGSKRGGVRGDQPAEEAGVAAVLRGGTVRLRGPQARGAVVQGRGLDRSGPEAALRLVEGHSRRHSRRPLSSQPHPPPLYPPFSSEKTAPFFLDHPPTSSTPPPASLLSFSKLSQISAPQCALGLFSLLCLHSFFFFFFFFFIIEFFLRCIANFSPFI